MLPIHLNETHMEITTARALDLQGAAAEQLDAIVNAAGQDTYLNDGQGSVPNHEYREAILKDGVVVGFFSPYMQDLLAERYWRAGPLYILPALRKQGIMRKALSDFFSRNKPGLAWIDDSNKASIQLFVKLGFTRHSAHPGRNGNSGHWYTLTESKSDMPIHALDLATAAIQPQFYRW